MRTTAAFAVIVVTLAALLAAGSPSGAQAPAGDSVTGTGTMRLGFLSTCCVITPFEFDVHSGPSGEDPVGSLQLLLPFDDPTCFVIRSGGGQVADEAVINFRNTLSGARVLVRIAGGTSGPRQIWLSTASSASDCSFVPPVSVAEVIEGGISIFDAPQLPTTTEQCKNGGWGTYGVFKNQGECVSFVASHGKNPPCGS